MTGKLGGAWLILTAGILWGTTGTSQALIPEPLPPLALGTIRLLIGSAGLMVWALWRGAFRTGRAWPRGPVALAAVAVAVYQPFFFSAVVQTGVAIGTVVAIGSAPLFAGLLGLTALREKPDWYWAAATGLSILGCGLLFLSGEGSGISGLGVLLALGAGAAYAVYATCGKIILKTQSPDALGAVVFSFAAVLLLPSLVLIDFNWPANSNSYLILLHLGLITTMAAYILFARGLSSVPASTAVTLSLSEPLTAGLLGIFLLGESFTPQTLVGLILLVAGLALLALRRE